MDARFEIAVARQYGTSHNIIVENLFLDIGIDRPGSTDTSAAAVAGDIEAQRIKMGLQTRRLKIFAHHARTGRE